MRTPKQLLQWHLYELTALLNRLEADHVARPIIETRLTEIKAALASIQ